MYEDMFPKTFHACTLNQLHIKKQTTTSRKFAFLCNMSNQLSDMPHQSVFILDIFIFLREFGRKNMFALGFL
jgi:hypothetical protein